ncbi:MAG: AsmA-like C-terminal domain-containing protein, partial [Campylobacter sp.]|nr:AsmA-like C-terminal domain-containing protein [Campylobacter sp.]
EGNFVTHEIKGKLDFNLTKDILTYKIYDANASGLKNFMDELAKQTKLNNIIKNWIYGYTKAAHYNIIELNGKANLAKNELFLNDLYAKAKVYDLNVTLGNDVPPIKIKDANLTLQNSRLSFKINSPSYEGKNLSGSNVHIYDIFSEKNAGIFIHIKTKAMLDDSVHKILNNYDLKLPIIQKSGLSDTDLTLDFKFNDLDVKANGIFKINKSNLDIANANFSVKNAIVELKNSTDLLIKAKDFAMDIFNADVDMTLDTKKLHGDINGKLNTLKIADVVNAKNQNFKATLDINDDETKLNFPDFGLALNFGDSSKISLQISDFLIKNSPLLQNLNVSKFDKVDVNTQNFTHFDINATNLSFKTPFYKKNFMPYDKDDFNIKVDNDIIKGTSKSGYLGFLLNKNNADLDINGLDLLIKTDDNSTNDFSSTLGEITAKLNAKNSNLIINDANTTLKLDKYQVWAKKDFIKLGSNAYGGRINLSKNAGITTIEARDIDGELVNELFGSKSFEGGKFKLKTINDGKIIKGEVRFYDTYFTDFVLYQQLLTFINTVPSLLTFSTPDFNQKGFTAKNGKILFEQQNKILNLKAIEINGTSADILGGGTINFNTDALDINLQIEVLKDASSIIEKIPVINQILLGKERKLTTAIKINGTTKEPKYQTQVATDTILAPFKLIRNVLEIPFLIFE